jgi:hypothetical protein
MASDVDTMNGIVTQLADATPSASGVAGVWSTARGGFTVQIDSNNGYWAVYDGNVWVAQRGHGSVSLQDALARLRAI